MAVAAMLAGLLVLIGALLPGWSGILFGAAGAVLFILLARRCHAAHRATRHLLPWYLRWIP